MVIRAREGLDLQGPYCFSKDHFFVPNDGILPEHAPKFHYLLPSSISTTTWCHNQGKCVLVYNSHIFCEIKEPYIHAFTELR